MITQNLEYNSIKVLRLPGVYGPYLKKNILFDIKNSNNLDQININSYYQWYNINLIALDIETANYDDRTIFNLFPEPVSTRDIVERFCDKPIGYEGKLMTYNYQTNTTTKRYWHDSETSLKEIGEFLCR